MKRIPFLPLFFVGLAVVFGGAVWVRVASYDGQPAELQKTAELNDTRAQERKVLSDGTTPVGAEGTIETFPDDDGSPSRARSKSREERYNELLRSTPPPAPAPKEPSLIDRMVAPIANALGMNRTKPEEKKAAPQQRVQPQPQSNPNRAESNSSQNDRNSDNTRHDPNEEQDPDTDTTPPQLVSAEFTPNEVHDGEETTLVAVVTDNLSGVRGVSGVVASPSGALQGFSCRNDGPGRYVARIAVPKDAAEGWWQVRYLTLSDNASNSINLNSGSGLPQTAQFRVTSSNSDSAGPKLTGARLERYSMRAGERNTMLIDAEDEKSGVAQVSGVFVSPSKTARIGFGCRQSGPGGSWECAVSPPTCLDCGQWSLEQIQLQDKANNMSTFRMDNQIVSAIKLDINADSCDSTPPVLQSLTLSPTYVSNRDGGTIRVEAILADEGCGVASLSGQAIPQSGAGNQRVYFSFDPSTDGRTFVGNIVIEKAAAKGIWKIAWLQALDKGHNLQPYQTNDPVIARVSFRVE